MHREPDGDARILLSASVPSTLLLVSKTFSFVGARACAQSQGIETGAFPELLQGVSLLSDQSRGFYQTPQESHLSWQPVFLRDADRCAGAQELSVL